jgi:hypothetical protein
MSTAANPVMRRLPNDAPDIQKRLQTMMEGDTVEFMTEHGVPVSVSRTEKGLETNVKVKVTCQTARILASALFFLAAIGVLASFLDGEGEVLTVAGLLIDRALIEEIAAKIASGVAFNTLVFFLAQHFC